MTKIHELADIGQAIWLDYISRRFIDSGELQALIDLGLRGMTSNPSIFEKAIAHSHDYDGDLATLVWEGKSLDEIYTSLVVKDIQNAADLLRPVYEHTRGLDGYVSLEVDPTLAHDTERTTSEAQRLWHLVDRPNLMIKIPATKAGLPSIRASIAAGLNINVTLIFSLERYAEVMAAYLGGLEIRAFQGLPLDKIASVASFFVSRVDSKIDPQLEAIQRKGGHKGALAGGLRGQVAVANARMAYTQFKAVFEGPQFSELRAKGAHVQRPLWASTSTKNPEYSDILYVQELIGAHTVNTLPKETLEKFLDHGVVEPTLETNLEQVNFVLQSLEDLGISMAQATQELEEEGVASFSKSFNALMQSIRDKRARLQQTFSAAGPLESPKSLSFVSGLPPVVEQALAEMEAACILPRVWEQDHTVWAPNPQEISNRLGWLHSPESMLVHVEELEHFVNDVKRDGYTHVLLLGMGGSSLAPDLFGHIFSDSGGLELHVLDSTAPEAVLNFQELLDPDKTLFIVSTKSGGTEETLSFFKTFYNWGLESLGPNQVGKHFVAITDPGSKLVDLARKFDFRSTFLNDPNIGGRYSALSYFGLLPAALSGVDIRRLLESALQMNRLCGPEVPVRENPAALLGAWMGEMVKAGRDKLTLVLSPQITSFADWVEQLIAESTGKAGTGILPVVGELLGTPAVYAPDRLFVHLQLGDDLSDHTKLSLLEQNGFPLARIPINDRYLLGGQFFLWELATALAGYRLGIQPFDQPNVESAKQRARLMMAAYRQEGHLPQETPHISQDSTQVFFQPGFEPSTHSSGEALAKFLAQAETGSYIALQAFLPPTERTQAALNELRFFLRDRYRLATTSGFGPRFLHSTGQLHKGDAGKGLFIQFTSESLLDAPIPTEAGQTASQVSFGTLILAQAMGDRQALLDAGRRVIRFHFTGDPASAIHQLNRTFEPAPST